MPAAPPRSLEGCRILVAEDEFVMADEVAHLLSDAGAEPLGPAPSVAKALSTAAETADIDGALLDVNLQGETIWPVVDTLLARGVPVVLATGYDAEAIPKAYAQLPRCQKPATGREILRTLTDQVMGRRVAAE